MVTLNKNKGLKGLLGKLRDYGVSERIQGLLIGFFIVVLVLVGQSMSFDDEVAQHELNCSVATYAIDNNEECSL
jgi:hypothetical protein